MGGNKNKKQNKKQRNPPNHPFVLFAFPKALYHTMTIGFCGVHAPLLPAVIVVDPCSSGQTLAEHAKATGAQVVAVRQPHAMSSHFRDIGYYAVVDWTNAKEVVAALRALPLRYMATLAGSEEGVEPNDEM